MTPANLRALSAHHLTDISQVMLRLAKPKRPPAAAYDSLGHVGRCRSCGQLWPVPSVRLGEAATSLRACVCTSCRAEAEGGSEMQVEGEGGGGGDSNGDGGGRGGCGGGGGGSKKMGGGGAAADAAVVDVAGPMWLGPMHDAGFVHLMAKEATRRG